ncbi:hypothetical protein BT63DRAFT_422471 [Microthyrium microscopicum]|uniref:Uncharacterized protein n=1 Tax=Microthyrium microscopicum TaxID=703497 RepID=A0A6A6ULJ9_9PEZI|nr:hypothetical protein BT63DRAFT_422471 [Microthyrium microscopicum]
MADPFSVLSVASVVIQIAAGAVLAPVSLIYLYGPAGVVLYLFGSRSTWRIQAEILGTLDDNDALDYRKAVQEECTMLSVASAIVAQIAITGLSLDKLSQAHWTARAFLLVSLISSLVAVYYATTQHRILGRLLKGSQIRSWIRGKMLSVNPQTQLTAVFVRSDSMLGDPADYEDDSYEDPGRAHSALMRRCFTPSVAAVITISAPQLLLSTSLFTLIIGFGLYFAFIWTRKLDTDAQGSDSRTNFIIYVVSTVVCLSAFSISRLIQNNDNSPESFILDAYVEEYKSKHPEVWRQWSKYDANTLPRGPGEIEEPVPEQTV